MDADDGGNMFFSHSPPGGQLALMALLLLALTTCDSRVVNAVVGDARAETDGAPLQDLRLQTCKRLVALGATALGPKTDYNALPALTHDGTHFGVAWLHGRSFSTSSPAALRFTRVDSGGRASSPEGVPVGTAVSSMLPALAHGGGEYGLLYREAKPGSTDTLLALLRPDGTTRQTWIVGTGTAWSLALARSGQGYAALVAEEGKLSDNLILARINIMGTGASYKKTVQTGNGYWLPWLALRPGGYMAAWDSTLARLGPDGTLQHSVQIKGGYSTVWAPSAVGYAVAYLSTTGSPPGDNVQLQLLDALGKRIGPPQAVGGSAGYGAMIARYISLTWTGGMHIVVYSRYSSSGSSQLVAQLFDAHASPVGGPVSMPMCTTRPASTVNLAAAWGGDTLAVAVRGGSSGSQSARLCLSRVRCQP